MRKYRIETKITNSQDSEVLEVDRRGLIEYVGQLYELTGIMNFAEAVGADLTNVNDLEYVKITKIG